MSSNVPQLKSAEEDRASVDEQKNPLLDPKRRLRRFGYFRFDAEEGKSLVQGPLKKRSCTDILCLVLFFICLAAFLALEIFLLIHTANLKRFNIIRFPVTKDGQCGVDDFIEYRFVFFANDDTLNRRIVPTCTKVCPEVDEDGTTIKTKPDCPPKQKKKCDQWANSKFKPWHTVKVGRRCLDNRKFRAFSDLLDALNEDWHIMLICVVISLLLSLVLLVSLRICTGVFVWISIVCTLVLCIAAGTLSIVYKEDLSVRTKSNTIITIISIMSYGAAAVILIMATCFSRAINDASRVVETASKFVLEVKAQLIQPIFFVVMQIMWLAVWIPSAVMLYMQNFDEYCEEKEAMVICKLWNTVGWWGVWIFMLLIGFWISSMISALNVFTTAYVTGVWYYEEEGQRWCGAGITLNAAMVGVMYHSGTFAFGGLLCAICKILVILANYLAAQQKKNETRMGDCMMKCLVALSVCLDRFVATISWYAYIHCALLGTNFCTSAQTAFSVMVRHPVRMSVSRTIVFIASFVCQVLVTSVSVGAAYFMLRNETMAKLAGGDQVGATAAPLFIVGCISFLVARTTMSSLSSATAALMHCLVADEDISKALSKVDLEGMNAVTHAPVALRQFIQNIG